mmetsp:Transcript_66182/g.215379  ORF Transcript_66182/g.215379 Transcript_66182/m.215379 type:complete len:418 (+) Transcript_66182:1917-3170(+)
MDELAVGQVSRIQPRGAHVFEDIHGPFWLGRLCTSLDHHGEEHLVRLDQLPSADRVEFLPRLLQLPLRNQAVDKNRVHNDIGLQLLVLHLVHQRVARRDVACVHVCFDESGVHLRRGTDELLPHSQEDVARKLGILQVASTEQQRHVGPVVGRVPMKLHGIVCAHGFVHLALQCLSTDQVVAIRDRRFALHYQCLEVFCVGIHLLQPRCPLCARVVCQRLQQTVLDLRVDTTLREALCFLAQCRHQAFGEAQVPLVRPQMLHFLWDLALWSKTISLGCGFNGIKHLRCTSLRSNCLHTPLLRLVQICDTLQLVLGNHFLGTLRHCDRSPRTDVVRGAAIVALGALPLDSGFVQDLRRQPPKWRVWSNVVRRGLDVLAPLKDIFDQLPRLHQDRRGVVREVFGGEGWPEFDEERGRPR